MELVSGGNLFDQIIKQNTFEEGQAASVINQLCLALNYMHKQNIMHRDLKPENLLCEKSDDGKIVIKLTDFGFATYFDPDKPQTLSLGSPLYMAPELCQERRYDKKVDVWSTGVITFALLTGQAPFPGQNKTEIYNAVINTEPDYSKVGAASQEAQDFIRACLQKDASARPSFEELLQLPWFNINQSDSIGRNTMLDIGRNIANYRKTTAFQAGVCSIIANLHTQAEELVEVREMFKKLDTDNDGLLKIEELEAGMNDICQIFNLDAPEVNQMFRAADKNKDGTIDYTEFISAAFKKDVLLSRTNLSGAFKQLDTNGDGAISKDELKQIFGGGHVAERGSVVWDDIMAEVDKDNDGVISFDEFVDSMRTVVEHRATFAKGV